MNFRKLASKQVKFAFKTMESLKQDATFILKGDPSFDFANGTVGQSYSNVPHQVIDIKTVHGLNGVRKTLIMERVDGLDRYDAVTLNTVVWQISGKLYDDGYIQMIEVHDGKVQ